MRKQFNLQDWLKDKSQRVETRDGRIVHNIWPVKNETTMKEYRTEVCALIDGEEDALVFFAGGKYLPVNAESPFDLFLVTPEEGLTEFEKKLWVVLKSEGSPIGPIEKFTNADKEVFHSYAAALLDLAKKELARQGEVITLDKLAPYDKGFQDGKAEVLRDLPRWRVELGDMEYVAYGIIGGGIASEENPRVYLDGHSINLYSLKKLPGFKED